jgi:tRNA-specific 2-thiouridylase
VIVGGVHDLARKGLRASDPHWVGEPPRLSEPLTARIRYHAEPVPARVTTLDDSSFELQFKTPVLAIAPGQAAVLYRGDEVVGGGTIEAALVAADTTVSVTEGV